MIGLDRDPAQYTLSALYLMHHVTPDVALDPGLPALAGQVPGVLTDFLQGNSGAVNHIQGNDLLPGVLAMFGWAAGSNGVFTGNVAIGAFGLLAVYALARRILGPLWGLAPVLLLAVTMPLAAFSRMPYTEPLAMIFVCGMLVALWVAVEQHRLWLFALAGVFAGATMIARIDGGLTIVAALCALSLLAIAPVSAVRRREGRLRAAALCGRRRPCGCPRMARPRCAQSEISRRIARRTAAGAGADAGDPAGRPGPEPAAPRHRPVGRMDGGSPAGSGDHRRVCRRCRLPGDGQPALVAGQPFRAQPRRTRLRGFHRRPAEVRRPGHRRDQELRRVHDQLAGLVPQLGRGGGRVGRRDPGGGAVLPQARRPVARRLGDSRAGRSGLSHQDLHHPGPDLGASPVDAGGHPRHGHQCGVRHACAW